MIRIQSGHNLIRNCDRLTLFATNVSTLRVRPSHNTDHHRGIARDGDLEPPFRLNRNGGSSFLF
jgi:hypothetical protein